MTDFPMARLGFSSPPSLSEESDHGRGSSAAVIESNGRAALRAARRERKDAARVKRAAKRSYVQSRKP